MREKKLNWKFTGLEFNLTKRMKISEQERKRKKERKKGIIFNNAVRKVINE